MKFFYGCANAEEAKEIYRKLAKCFHPDKGGSVELMKELSDQYDKWDEPIIAPKQSNSFTPNNMGSWYQGRFSDAFGNPYGNNQSFNSQGIAKDLEITMLKTKIKSLEDQCRVNASVSFEFSQLRSELERKINESSMYFNRYIEESKKTDKLEEMIGCLKESMEHHKESNESFVKEISRLTKLKEPKTIIDKIKYLIRGYSGNRPE